MVRIVSTRGVFRDVPLLRGAAEGHAYGSMEPESIHRHHDHSEANANLAAKRAKVRAAKQKRRKSRG